MTERWATDRMHETEHDSVRLQPEYIEVSDTGEVDTLVRILHNLGRLPRGARIVNKIYSNAQSVLPSLPCGTIFPHGKSGLTSLEWLACQGQAVSRTTYSDLFAVIGTSYGPGDGSTTFNLPDLRGRIPMGAGAGAGDGSSGSGLPSGAALTARSAGDWAGGETHTLTVGEMPAHTHTIPYDDNASGAGSANDAADPVSTRDSGSTGGDGAHNNLQPFQVVGFYIKYTVGTSAVTYIPLDWYRLDTDKDWNKREIFMRFNIANARVLLEVF